MKARGEKSPAPVKKEVIVMKQTLGIIFTALSFVSAYVLYALWINPANPVSWGIVSMVIALASAYGAGQCFGSDKRPERDRKRYQESPVYA